MTPKYHFKDVEVDRQFLPKELGYALFAAWVNLGDRTRSGAAPRSEQKGREDHLLGYAWPGVIKQHIDHWATRPDAREYAADDIVYTKGLDDHFKTPPPGDDDSILACMAAACYWRGAASKINIKGDADDVLSARGLVTKSNPPRSTSTSQETFAATSGNASMKWRR